jgi:hypothetical protein
MSSFTYVISSRDDLSDNTRALSCFITLGGLPERARYFRCRVLHFAINTCSLTTGYMTVGSSRIINLICDNFVSNGYRAGNKDLNIISSYSLDCPMRAGSVFNIPNFNGKTLNFRLVSEAEAPITPVINQNSITTIWYLTLELTPIDEF